MSSVKIILTGNLVASAETKQKNGSDTIYKLFTVAVSEKKDVTKFYTCFAYGVSDLRAKLLTKGTLVQVIGVPDEKIYQSPNSEKPEIQRTVSVLSFDILFSKKDESPAE